MRSFVVGVFIGLVAGGGGVYLALEKPWAGEGTKAKEAAPEPTLASGKKAKKRKKRRRKASSSRTGSASIPILSAADRKLVWKGAKVALPTRALDMGSEGDSGRPLRADEINGVISAESESLLSCIEQSRGLAPLKATVTLKMLVGSDGRVQKSRLRAPAYLFRHGFYPCAKKAAAAMRFPATGAATVVTTPYELY